MIYINNVSSKTLYIDEKFLWFIVFSKSENSHRSESGSRKFFHSIHWCTTMFGPSSISSKTFFSDKEKSKYTDDGTSLYFRSESAEQYETTEHFCKTWRLVTNSIKSGPMLFNKVEISARNPFREVGEVHGVQIDRQLKFRSFVEQLTAFNLFTWKVL